MDIVKYKQPLAVEIRRKAAIDPAILSQLGDIDKSILQASARTTIAEFEDNALVDKTRQLFRFIAIDVGYIIPSNPTDWAYIQTRLVDILKKYYSTLTLADIKLAFELATTGELDAYLPRDGSGNPDKKHYQQFNADYFGKILGAYKKRQADVNARVESVRPKELPMVTESQKAEIKRYRNTLCESIFERYKETGQLSYGLGEDKLLWDWLVENGHTKEVEIAEEDKKKAFNLFMQKASQGLVNSYTAYQVRREGIESKTLEFSAYSIARDKAILKIFEKLKNEGK